MAHREYPHLPTVALNAESDFAQPNELPSVIHLEDSVISIMTDYQQIKPTTTRPEAFINDALIEMRVCGEHILLVVDSNHKVVGLISSGDILGAKTVNIIQEKRLARGEVCVSHVMTPQSHVACFSHSEIEHAKVGSVVKTLRELKQHYALVVEENGQQKIRGLLSLSRISKALGTDVASGLHDAHGLAELQRMQSKD